jgi:hypothetical protein
MQLLDNKQEMVPLLETLRIRGFTRPTEADIIQNACDAAQGALMFSAVAPPLRAPSPPPLLPYYQVAEIQLDNFSSPWMSFDPWEPISLGESSTPVLESL